MQFHDTSFDKTIGTHVETCLASKLSYLWGSPTGHKSTLDCRPSCESCLWGDSSTMIVTHTFALNRHMYLWPVFLTWNNPMVVTCFYGTTRLKYGRILWLLHVFLWSQVSVMWLLQVPLWQSHTCDMGQSYDSYIYLISFNLFCLKGI